ncbi:MAG: hypothetical protein K940chlam5_00652 [Candidatus Anoxychlamydiales bacterium]|nr:hypothetical protein [Candidatus Anoxychlamydiales bacterium]
MSVISSFNLVQFNETHYSPHTDIFSNPFDSNPLQNTVEKFLTNNEFHINFLSKDIPITFINDEAFLDLSENDFNDLLNVVNNKGFKIHVDTLRLFIKSASYLGYTNIVLDLLKTFENLYQYQTFLTLAIAYAASNNKTSTLNSLKSLLREANIPIHYLDLPENIFTKTEDQRTSSNQMPLFTFQAKPRSLFDSPAIVTTFSATRSFLPPVYEAFTGPVVTSYKPYLLEHESFYSAATPIEIPPLAASKSEQKSFCSTNLFLVAMTISTLAGAAIINTYYYQFI